MGRRLSSVECERLHTVLFLRFLILNSKLLQVKRSLMMNKNVAFLIHNDLGQKGSEFIYKHPTLTRNIGFLFFTLSSFVATISLNCLSKYSSISICFGLLAAFFLIISSKVHSETFLILPSIGVQVETLFYLGNKTCHFIDVCNIQDIVINEGISMLSISHYLVVLLKNPESIYELYPVFPHSLPPLKDLIQVYRAAQQKLIQCKD